MLSGAAICPSAPVLLPGLTGRDRPEAVVRAAALACVGAMIDSGCSSIAILGEGERPEAGATVGAHRYGGLDRARTGTPVLPLSLAVGTSLLAEAGWDGPVHGHPIPADAEDESVRQLGRAIVETAEPVGLLVIGSASACSTDKAPGGLSPQSGTFNAELAIAVRECDARTLAAIPAAAFAEQMSDLRLPLLALLAAIAGRSMTVTMAFEDAPFGVQYLCAAMV